MTTYGIALGGPYVCRGCGVHHVHTSPCETPLDDLDRYSIDRPQHAGAYDPAEAERLAEDRAMTTITDARLMYVTVVADPLPGCVLDIDDN